MKSLSSVEPRITKCVPVDFLWLPSSYRRVFGAITMTLFCWTFLAVPVSVIYTLFVFNWRHITSFDVVLYGSMVISLIIPVKEWPVSRKFAQLWYEILDFSCNLEPDILHEFIEEAYEDQYIIAMHPHGIIPIQAVLWTAYCDQYMTTKTGKKLYGFGAAADILMYLPYLRNIMAWLSGGSATYKALKNGLAKGLSPPVNAAGRTPRNLYILPGGIAEIFTSTPGKHAVVFNRRRGLVKLALETGASLLPTYVFGGTDFFHNLATSDSWISKLSRRLRMGVTLFWGPYYLPIPYFPKVTLCIADPIKVNKWDSDDPIPVELIEELHDKYINSLKDLFNKYKVLAGHPDAVLEII